MNSSFASGFIKQAQSAGLTEGQAVDLLKESGLLDQLMSTLGVGPTKTETLMQGVGADPVNLKLPNYLAASLAQRPQVSRQGLVDIHGTLNSLLQNLNPKTDTDQIAQLSGVGKSVANLAKPLSQIRLPMLSMTGGAAPLAD